MAELTGKGSELTFHKVDLLDKEGLERVFQHHGGFRACIHFAGLKAVGESVAKPLSYYDNNLTGTLNLLEAMRRHGCNIIGAFRVVLRCVGGNDACNPLTHTWTHTGSFQPNPIRTCHSLLLLGHGLRLGQVPRHGGDARGAGHHQPLRADQVLHREVPRGPYILVMTTLCRTLRSGSAASE